MNVVSLYRKLKQILNDSNTALVNKGLNTVSSLNNIPPEIEKLQINNLPYFLGEMLTEITEDHLSECTTISERAFYDFDHITSVTIPDSVTTIGAYAFHSCTGLTSITIPDSVTSIGEYAFYNTAYYKNDKNWENGVLYIGNHIVDTKEDISGSYIVKAGTLTISNYTFYRCTGLTSLTIPDSVKSIGESVLILSNLADMYLNPSVPPILHGRLYIPTTTTIHVPVGSGDAYKNATNWSTYADQIVEDIVVE